MVEQFVRQQVEEDKHYRFGENSLIPKRARVVDFDDRLNPFGFQIGKEFTFSGEGFLPVNVILGRRTVFLEKPINIDGVAHYLEVKGYGRNGQELYPETHVEGDLYFGMYLDSAKKEFYLPKLLRTHGIGNTQRPIALLQFDTEDFVRYSSLGLTQLISARLQLGPHQERVRKALHRICPEYRSKSDDFYWDKRDELGQGIAAEFLRAFQNGGIEEIRKWAGRFNLLNEVNGLNEEQEFGYVIRAVKSPLRVGDLHDRSIVTEKNQQIARQIGQTVRKMLELGFWHTSPNPGNWTTEGELVDFEDVVEYPRETPLIEKDMRFRKFAALKDYVKFTFGEGTIGYLTKEFQQGFMGSRTTTQEVVDTALVVLDKLSPK